MCDDRLDAIVRAMAHVAARRQVFRGLLGGGALLVIGRGRVAAAGQPNRCTSPKNCAEMCRNGEYGSPPVDRDRCMVTCLNAQC
jgi:hypothetical protein